MRKLIIKTSLLVYSLFFYQNTGYSQDIAFSQQFSNLVAINPAFSGTTLGERINFYYRNQWLGNHSGFQNFGFTYDSYLSKYNSGIGVLVNNDIQGAYIAPSIDISYSYIIKLDRDFYLSMGLQAGINQKYLSTSKLEFEQNESIASGLKKTYPDFVTGIIGLSKNTYFGLAVDHIGKPYTGVFSSQDSRLNRKYSLFAGYIYELKTRLISQHRYISPNVLVQLQGLQQNINWGIAFQYENLLGGLWVRHNLEPHFESTIIYLGYKTKSFRFTYSYDVNIGKRTTRMIGAHEISVTRLLPTQKSKKNYAHKSMSFLLQ
ncbi:MAG: PorP/SprF family type IX secretion system membrane protein [Salinivirgaceae bacterium]|nr:PorP/SprF family type IX secretion system membrane protein [Salinivirgaceae bacterium]